ncbi:hypothetical protein LTR94_028422, partial [Friedmanniomyces endolithicus]
HLYIGQEAVADGVKEREKHGHDKIITGYRDHGHMLAAGMDPKEVMAELTGRIGGSSKGKGGSMHMFDVPTGFYGGHGIVGAQVALGTGLAFAGKYRGDDSVSFVYFGDGASNQGQVYESFNMAQLWKLPAIYIIENNQYAMGTSIERSSSTTQLSQRGASFGIPGEQVDGMDVIAVRDAEDYVTETSYTAFDQIATVTRRKQRATNPAAIGTLPVVATDPKDAVTQFFYDRLGRVVRTVDAEGYNENSRYNSFGEVVQATNKLGGVTSRRYDRRGQVVAETVAKSSFNAAGDRIVSPVAIANLDP